MKKLVSLAVTLIVPLMLLSAPRQAQAQAPTDSCPDQLMQLIEDTKNLATCKPRETNKTRSKLLKKLADAQKHLAMGTVKSQYQAAKKVWEFDYELRKLFFKNEIWCGDGAQLDESALALLICIVDLYYPDSGYDPAANGVISCQ